MAGHFNNMPGMPPYFNMNPQRPMMPMDSGYPPPGFAPNLQPFQTLSSENLRQSYADLDDPNRTLLPAQGSSRARRRPAPGAEHVKHRRTRSGCYTCRNRRVKCDETHPICERCRKGNRECIYPEPAAANKSGRSKTKGSSPQSNSSADDDDQDAKAPLPAIPDEDEPGDASSHHVRYYLDWFRNNITCHHYCLKYDGADFMRTTLLEIAVHNDHLLYAVVGFAAYHHTLIRPNGRIADFLSYYNRSVQLLRLSLQRNQRRTPATLLTILQLATIEEYLGDWVNLIGHQRAAYEIITSMYTPQTIMQNETLRRIINWYQRFDLMGGIMSGYETVLGRDWFLACTEYYTQQTRDRPHDVGCKFDEKLSFVRLFANDSSTLFSRKAKGQISDEVFAAECMALDKRIDEWLEHLDPALTDSSKHITNFDGAPARDPDDVVDPYDPQFMYGDELFPMNIVLIDYWAIALMFKMQLCNVFQKEPSPEVQKMAYDICKMFESLEMYPHSPPGIVIEASAAIGMGVVHLPRDDKHVMWGRRKFAKVEAQGYIYPSSMRMGLSEAFGVDVSQSWLPNNEGMPNIILQIRSFIEERATIPKDQNRQDLREMRGIFENLSVKERKGSGASHDSASAAAAAAAFSLGATGEELANMDFGAGDAMIYENSPDYGWNYSPQSTQFSEN
ncbi:putative c6 finger domain protein [Neofusicoccum parvum UCRNP2]|uniref:C6 finger domain-containing protein n=2 Tax=Neofusicoccum parvum TaxID=310453 RepID=A0ACB5SFY6_9PEZI|nr:putative c6 finger domain protein [Neofusicoccum parvum UCRNP2]GME39098.1 C6 finger domain-containing protein [Neofusicoccum parvum]